MSKSKADAIAAGLDPDKLPRHVAISMDGNGRWAAGRGQERCQGHFRGVDAVIDITRASSDLGISHLIGDTIEAQTPFLVENNVRLNLIGELERIPAASLAKLKAGVAATAHCTGLVLTMALSYSGRWELADAARRLALQAQRGELRPDDIDEQRLSDALSTAPLPDPDLLIRTGGECRISNFLLWQAAYAELYFTPVLWPDFDRDRLVEALRDYQHRERRFGKTSQQLTDTHDHK